MKKTTCRFDWQNGHTKCRRLSRSFDTLESAERFTVGKQNAEIYMSKGRYKVDWVKITDTNDDQWNTEEKEKENDKNCNQKESR